MPITYMDRPYSESDTLEVFIPIVREWFVNKFKHFSPPQTFSINNIHNKQNTLISSPTGSGKTLSAFAAILNELIQLSSKDLLENKVYCIYISPLKALANDIEKNLNQPLEEIKALAEDKLKGASKKINLKVAIRTGDTSLKDKALMLKKTPHILITTPESFAIMLTSPKFREKMREVEWVIVDEIHALASSKRGTQLVLGLERLNYLVQSVTLGREFTRIGLSATVSPLEKVAQFLVGMQTPTVYRDCKIIDVQAIKKLDLKVLSPVPDLIGSDYEKTSTELYILLDKLIQEHRTTLIFTNTRSATERIVHHLKDKFPKNYTKLDEGDNIKTASEATNVDEMKEIVSKSYIGAHHSSLSKEHRLNIENRLKDGKLRCVVSSTSLELGIDIGFIDLVILLGSPKSVARALQRIGRSGHRLHDTSKGRIIVQDRDDLVECSVLLKAAIDKKIDKITIPENALDILAQEIYGMAIEEPKHIDQIFKIVTQSYPYRNLTRKDFTDVINYLTGQYISLEDRNVYAKIWFDAETGMIGKKGKLARVLYLTNLGTIPDESFVTVKLQGSKNAYATGNDEKGLFIGKIDESFLERLKRGDVFVLGGNTYEYLHSQGMTAFVKTSINRPPTVPSWFSESLPLSFDLALEIGKFRRYMNDQFESHTTKKELMSYIHHYLYVDAYGANAIYEYFKEQYQFSKIPHDKRIIIEYFTDGDNKFILFHTLYGRRVNDVLSRVLGFVISRMQHRDVEINITDNGFYILTQESIQASRAFKLIKASDIRKIAELSLDKTEVLARRFRHCAMRSLMILRNYMGRRKTVSRQQMSSKFLISAVRRISEDFPILREAKREVLEDLMDINGAQSIIEQIESGRISIEEVATDMPSPFAFNLITLGYTDIMKMEDKLAFVRRMHDMVKAKISLKEARSTTPEIILPDKDFDYDIFWKEQEVELAKEHSLRLEQLKLMAWDLKNVPLPFREHLVEVLDGTTKIREDFIAAVKLFKADIDANWPSALREELYTRLRAVGEQF
ncbi:MAG: DEAD/DEAH box helicase [Candidatus Woesearchaeota archaeon]